MADVLNAQAQAFHKAQFGVLATQQVTQFAEELGTADDLLGVNAAVAVGERCCSKHGRSFSSCF